MSDLGFGPAFSVAVPLDGPSDAFVARVAADHGALVTLLKPERLIARPNRPDDPLRRAAVGDWVVAVPTGGDPAAIVTQVLPRRSELVRQRAGGVTAAQVVAANVDVVFVVTSMNRDFNVSRIERYLAAVADSGAEAVVVVNKADLDLGGQRRYQAQLEALGDVDVVFTSAVLDGGLEPLLAYLAPGRTVALVGSSGVGKSSLINGLLGEQAQLVRSQRLDDDRGRHTTTGRELFVLPGGRGLLMDTPGMRELALWSGDGVDQAFADIGELEQACRFRDCSHDGEPGCAIEAALQDGRLYERRWRSHLKLQREAEFAHRRQSVAATRAASRAWAKRVREAKKDRW